MSQKVSIIDYGVGNLLNVVRAFQHCDADVDIAENANSIINSGLLVLPGVGAFSDGMNELKTRNFVQPILKHVQAGKPLLGICLGMQMLVESSEEHGRHLGLGIIKGNVVAIPNTGIDGKPHKIPHIGWNELRISSSTGWNGSIMDSVPEGSAVYFVHSFMVEPKYTEDRLADCNYDGQKICASIQHGNVMGLQFHPEKSGEIGLHIIRNFINYS